MDDTISRQAAIDAFEMNCYPIRYDHNSIEKGMTITGIKQVLDELPPAQPRPFGTINHAGAEHPLSDEEIIPRLREIQEQVGGSYAIDRAIELLTVQPEPCEDAVSRQAAIEAIKAKRLWHGQYLTNSTAGYDYAIEVLKELPSVQSKPLTGNWIKVTNTLCKCNRCGAVQLKGHFCKDCGAKMEV